MGSWNPSNHYFVDPAAPGVLQTIGFVNPAVPGDFQAIGWLGPTTPGALQIPKLVNPACPGGLQASIFHGAAAPGVLHALSIVYSMGPPPPDSIYPTGAYTCAVFSPSAADSTMPAGVALCMTQQLSVP